ncbi:MAG: hypothetical protein ABEL51_04635 [Salinibacter sp.]
MKGDILRQYGLELENYGENDITSKLAMTTILNEWFTIFPQLKQHISDDPKGEVKRMADSWSKLMADLSPLTVLEAGLMALQHQEYPTMPAPGTIREHAYELMGTTRQQYMDNRRKQSQMAAESEQLDRQLSGDDEPSADELEQRWRDGQVTPIANQLAPYLPEGEGEPSNGNGGAEADRPSLDHDPDCPCDECEASRQRVEERKRRALTQLQEGQYGESVANAN